MSSRSRRDKTKSRMIKIDDSSENESDNNNSKKPDLNLVAKLESITGKKKIKGTSKRFNIYLNFKRFIKE
jgi:hypothetical protein